MKRLTKTFLFGLLAIAAPLQAQESQQQAILSCGNFEDKYYFLDHHNIIQASTFFQTLSIDGLEDKSQKLSSTIGRLNLSTQYFDTANLTLLKQHTGISQITNTNLPKYRPKREQIIWEASNQKRPIKVKNYNRKVDQYDKHPLLGKVRRKDRAPLIKELAELGISNPQELNKQLDIKTQIVTRQFRLYGEPVAEISIKNHEIENFGIPTRVTEFAIEKVYSPKKSILKAEEKKEISKLLCEIDSHLNDQVKGLQSKPNIGYPDLYSESIKKLPARHFFKTIPVAFKLGQALILSILGFLLITLIKGRYTKTSNEKKTQTVRSRLI